MTIEIALVLGLALFAIILFATERYPVDLTVMILMGAMLLSGIITPEDAIGGFSNPATVTDVALVEKVLLEVAAANPDVLENPPPAVRLMEFGDSGLGFELRAWSTTLIHKRGLLTSSLNIGIYRIFKENNIEIPYPRRNVQILSEPAAKSREED